MSGQSIKTAARKYVPMMFGLRIPGFIRIHWRYARGSFITWLVLFVAPFIIGASSISVICRRFLQVGVSSWQIILITLFIIALAFFFAERHRKFRRIYVMAIPAIVIINGLFQFLFSGGPFSGNIIKFGILSGLPAWWLGRHAMGKGYRLLSNGADKDYRPGRDFYMDGRYVEAFAHLEPAARRGHMKSLYLLGHAHEHGNGRDRDRIKAARLYDKASSRGYGKASRAFETLFRSFTPEEIKVFETDLSIAGINELL